MNMMTLDFVKSATSTLLNLISPTPASPADSLRLAPIPLYKLPCHDQPNYGHSSPRTQTSKVVLSSAPTLTPDVLILTAHLDPPPHSPHPLSIHPLLHMLTPKWYYHLHQLPYPLDPSSHQLSLSDLCDVVSATPTSTPNVFSSSSPSVHPVTQSTSGSNSGPAAYVDSNELLPSPSTPFFLEPSPSVSTN